MKGINDSYTLITDRSKLQAPESTDYTNSHKIPIMSINEKLNYKLDKGITEEDWINDFKNRMSQAYKRTWNHIKGQHNKLMK